MKLRIKGNSLRLRITPSEMACLLETGRIAETIHFSMKESARLTYAVEHEGGASALSVRHTAEEVAIVLSSEEVRRWAAAHDVGLYGQVSTSGGPLDLAIEKDFACLDKSDEQNADTFPNPRQGTIC